MEQEYEWEIGLRHRPVNSQLFLPLPVAQDMAELSAPTAWERMQEEYNVLRLFPAVHIMASLRTGLYPGLRSSRDIERLGNRAEPLLVWLSAASGRVATWCLSLWRTSLAMCR
jgi:error-prone DNA polymerase